MKKVFLPLVMFILLSFTTGKNSITKSERKFAIAQLKNSKSHLLSAVEGLSTTQLNFKPGQDSWSIAGCTEHIAISENMLFAMFEGTLKQTPDPTKRSEVKMTDEQLIAMITDRTNKVKTQEAFVPTGKFGSHQGSVSEFVSKRDSHISFIKKTKEDLRNRYQQLPFGTIDSYQVILFIAAHTERHIKQIEEVKANADFPKN